MDRQIQLAKSILESAGYTVTLREAKEKLKFEDLVKYPYTFIKQWKYAPNSTYGDDFLELAEEYNCIQIRYNNGYNNTCFICKDKADYQKLVDALSQNKILRDFISLSALRDMDWDSLASKLCAMRMNSIYVDRYSGGYTVKIPMQKKVKESIYIDDLLAKVGGSKVVNGILDDAVESYYPDGVRDDSDIKEIEDMTYEMVKDKVSKEEWSEIIEYVW